MLDSRFYFFRVTTTATAAPILARFRKIFAKLVRVILVVELLQVLAGIGVWWQQVWHFLWFCFSTGFLLLAYYKIIIRVILVVVAGHVQLCMYGGVFIILQYPAYSICHILYGNNSDYRSSRQYAICHVIAKHQTPMYSVEMSLYTASTWLIGCNSECLCAMRYVSPYFLL